VSAIDIRTGDCRELLREIPDASVHCVVTSPPYWGQRDYGVDGMIGLEPSVDEWVAEMVAVFREVRRVLRDDGTVWLNLGDKYWGTGGGNNNTGLSGRPMPEGDADESGRPRHDRQFWGTHEVLKSKDLLGLPWRVAFALQADGWWLRSDIIWSKPNPMPSSVTDRPSTAHEYVFLLTKSARYFYDAEGTRESTPARVVKMPDGWNTGEGGHGDYHRNGRESGRPNNAIVTGRNRRSVWTIATAPFPGEHYATYPPALVEPCIKAGTSEHGVCAECGAPWERVVSKTLDVAHVQKHRDHGNGQFNRHYAMPEQVGTHRVTTTGWRATCDHAAEPIPATVLDPFSGAGTTGLVAQRLGRDYIGLELNPEYAEMSRKRIADDLLTEADERIERGQAAMFDMEDLRS